MNKQKFTFPQRFQTNHFHNMISQKLDFLNMDENSFHLSDNSMGSHQAVTLIIHNKAKFEQALASRGQTFEQFTHGIGKTFTQDLGNDVMRIEIDSL